MHSVSQNYKEKWHVFTVYAYKYISCIFLSFRYANYMLITYYANKNVPHGCQRDNQAWFYSLHL